jgi:hypothetical protein
MGGLSSGGQFVNLEFYYGLSWGGQFVNLEFY